MCQDWNKICSPRIPSCANWGYAPRAHPHEDTRYMMSHHSGEASFLQGGGEGAGTA
jgi:hypothetical protein